MDAELAEHLAVRQRAARAEDFPREVEHARRDDLRAGLARGGAIGLDPDAGGSDLGDAVGLRRGAERVDDRGDALDGARASGSIASSRAERRCSSAVPENPTGSRDTLSA